MKSRTQPKMKDVGLFCEQIPKSVVRLKEYQKLGISQKLLYGEIVHILKKRYSSGNLKIFANYVRFTISHEEFLQICDKYGWTFQILMDGLRQLCRVNLIQIFHGTIGKIDLDIEVYKK